jgi:CDP-diacylglycerol--serine O-phosphatidyltransferase
MVPLLPSLLTLANAVCGFGSITYAAKVGPEITTTPQELYYAALLIFAAIVFDILDGPVARLAKQTSQFGAQLDSLADAISFGVAPAFLMLKFSQAYHPRVMWVIAVLYMLCAVLRLARFNVSKDDERYRGSFCGLPSPSAAGTVASLVVIGPGLLRWSDSEISHIARVTGNFLIDATEYGLPIVTLVVACLMVSRIRYPRLPGELLRGKHSYRQLVKVIFLLVAILAVHELAIPLVFLCLVAASPLRALWCRVVPHAAPTVPVAPTVPPTS